MELHMDVERRERSRSPLADRGVLQAVVAGSPQAWSCSIAGGQWSTRTRRRSRSWAGGDRSCGAGGS